MGLISFLKKRFAKKIAIQTPAVLKQTFSFFTQEQQDVLKEVGNYFGKAIRLPEGLTGKITKAFLTDKVDDNDKKSET